MQCVPYEAKLDYADAVSTKNDTLVRRMLSKYPGIDRMGV